MTERWQEDNNGKGRLAAQCDYRAIVLGLWSLCISSGSWWITQTPISSLCFPVQYFSLGHLNHVEAAFVTELIRISQSSSSFIWHCCVISQSWSLNLALPLKNFSQYTDHVQLSEIQQYVRSLMFRDCLLLQWLENMGNYSLEMGCKCLILEILNESRISVYVWEIAVKAIH